MAACAAAALLLVVCVLTLPGGSARATPAPDALPDLAADPPTNPVLDYFVSANTGQQNLLLRFDGFIHNVGTGALELRGSRVTTSDPMAPLQRVYQSGGGSYRDDPMPAATQLTYNQGDGHQHWHFDGIARYSLWSEDKSHEVTPAAKVGFCLEDSEYTTETSPGPAVYRNTPTSVVCGDHSPSALSLFEGVSPGWRDAYTRNLAFQWVVVSDVQPGVYWLQEEVDPENIIHESDEANAPAWSTTPFTIPGYIAKAITAPPLPYGQLQKVDLAADVYGTPGARRFRIVTPPQHGTLNVATGSTFEGPSVTYRPNGGYTGADQFTYEAVDSTSPYPVHPGTATVALTVGVAPAPRVVIANAPTALYTGTGVQLKATVTNDFSDVTWSVNGVPGGTARTGTITQGGFYRAPQEVPATGHVTISARSAAGASDSRTIAIIWTPPPGPAPGTTTGSGKSKGILGSIATGLSGHILVASVKPKRAGTVSIKASVGRTRLGECSAKTPKHRRFTCRIRVAPGTDLRNLKIVARLVRHHKVVARVQRLGRP